MSQEWYYSVDGSQQGPVAAAELKKLANEGKLKPEDLVWKDGMPEWKPASTIKGLFGGGGTSSATAPIVKPDAKADSKAEAPAAKAEPARRPRDDDEEEDRPRRRRDEDEEDERPSKSRRRDDDDEDEDRPSKSRRRDEDDEDEEDRPRRRRDEDEDDEYDRPRKKRKKGRVPEDTANKKMVAGLLAILIGWLGIHKFYLGMPGPGVITILLSCIGVGGIIALIEGIIYLTKTDEDFYRDYIVNQKQWF